MEPELEAVGTAAAATPPGLPVPPAAPELDYVSVCPSLPGVIGQILHRVTVPVQMLVKEAECLHTRFANLQAFKCAPSSQQSSDKRYKLN